MTPMMLLALTRWAPREMWMALRKRPASWVSLAAALACRPSLLLTTISIEGIDVSSGYRYRIKPVSAAAGVGIHDTAQRPDAHLFGELVGVVLALGKRLQDHAQVGACNQVHIDTAFSHK